MNINIGRLAWELSVLQRAVAFPNLSSASRQIGISQPQLSRILQRLESELKVHLLDRKIKRLPHWTKESHQIAQAYRDAVQSLEKEIRSLGAQTVKIEKLSIASLEGLSHVGLKMAEHLLKNDLAQSLVLDVLDLNDLIRLFEAGEYDIVLSSHRSAKKKCAIERRLGFQTLEETTLKSEAEISIKSSTEFLLKKQISKNKENLPLFISNSLNLRKLALQKFKATAILPSEIYQKSRGTKVWEQEVILLVRDYLNDPIMEYLDKFTD